MYLTQVFFSISFFTFLPKIVYGVNGDPVDLLQLKKIIKPNFLFGKKKNKDL